MSKTKIYGHWQGKRYDYGDIEKTTKTFLTSELISLHNTYNITGIKQSFEDEGVILNDVMTMRRITENADLQMYVKIGGCEAITDINNCVNMGINSIIAPMVETVFSLQKFVSAVKNIESTSFYFVCETKTALKNLDRMLRSDENRVLSGVVVGRSDFTKSYGLPKDETDSEFINTQVLKALKICKKYGMQTTMGGNISTRSCEFIQKAYNENLLDKIETRNVVIDLDDNNTKELNEAVSAALLYEIGWLKFKGTNYASIGHSYLDRSEALKGRI